MRIGIEAQRIFRRKKHGMDVVALESIRALQQADKTNEYIIFVRPGPDPECLRPTPNFRIVAFPGLTYADWEQVRLPRAAREFGIDLLHCTSNTAPTRLSVPLVVTVHDVIFMEKGPLAMRAASAYQRLGQIYRRHYVPIGMSLAQRILTVSDYEKKCILARFPEVDLRLEVVPNAVSLRFFDSISLEKRKEVANRYQLPSRYILFLGNTDPKKNVQNVLEGYAKYTEGSARPLPLVVADLSQGRISKALQRIGRADVANWIVRAGYISPLDTPAVYAGATVFLYPSLRESFGLPILEAMASSTPVITSYCTAMPEVAGDAALFVNPREPSHIAQMIRLATEDSEIANAIRQRGLRRAKMFTWQNTAARLVEVYRSVLAESESKVGKAQAGRFSSRNVWSSSKMSAVESLGMLPSGSSERQQPIGMA
ncbi:glycosyltransferase family 4 protein [Rhodothermus sp. AH-315-K08]|nr:glycosyltransferase family 4 protein [Rhodothermus sp. AH-315-K08]